MGSRELKPMMYFFEITFYGPVCQCSSSNLHGCLQKKSVLATCTSMEEKTDLWLPDRDWEIILLYVFFFFLKKKSVFAGGQMAQSCGSVFIPSLLFSLCPWHFLYLCLHPGMWSCWSHNARMMWHPSHSCSALDYNCLSKAAVVNFNIFII